MNENALLSIRKKIDAIDEQLLTLISKRAECALEVAKIKQKNSPNPVYYRPEREAEILQKVTTNNSGPLSSEAISAIFTEIINKCRDLQEPLKAKPQTSIIKIKQLTIIGLGLIGGSIAKSVKQKNFCESVVGYDTNDTTLKKAYESKMIDRYENNISAAAKNAELIIIAAPLENFSQILSEIKNVLETNTVITDIISVKANITHQAENILKEKFKQFVPGHPIAGSEKSGLDAASANLFKNRRVLLTPTEKTDIASIEKVTQFWQTLGASVELLSADEHDAFLALTSHIPQILVYLFMDQIKQQNDYPSILKYTGNGFKDFIRLAGSNPSLWIDIILANDAAILKQLKQLNNRLDFLQNAIEQADQKALLEIFDNANLAKTDFDKA